MTARINITIDEELDKRFRQAIVRVIGFKKGNLQVAVTEAIELWIKAHPEGKK